MPAKAKAKALKTKPSSQAVTTIGPTAPRRANGTFQKGYSGRQGLDLYRARRELNADTIGALHEAFRRGGREAIDKVMKNAPAQFIKYLVLLVPRELEVTHTGGVKAMSDEALEQAIAAVEEMLAKRAENTIDVTPSEAASVGTDVGRAADKPD